MSEQHIVTDNQQIEAAIRTLVQGGVSRDALVTLVSDSQASPGESVSNRVQDLDDLTAALLSPNQAFGPRTSDPSWEPFRGVGSELARSGALSSQFIETLTSRIDVSHVANLNARVFHASLLLGSAFRKAGVTFKPKAVRGPTSKPDRADRWYASMVEASLANLNDVRAALQLDWMPPRDAEPFVLAAFVLLADLTPARAQLTEICKANPRRAYEMLGEHLELIRQQFLLTVRLVTSEEARNSEQIEDEVRFAAARDAILDRSGRLLSLTEAARLLDITRQALHQKIQKGTALGITRDRALVLPEFQIVTDGDGKLVVLPGLQGVVSLFIESEAGALSALQFLIDEDENLETTPLDALRAGDIPAVTAAARAFLSLDEE